MKRAIFTIFLAVTVLVLISAHEGPLSGNAGAYSAPRFSFGEGDSVVSLDDMRGKYVLLTFWSSDDARSRIANIEYSSLANRYPSLEHIGVNMDNSPSMFREILKRDNIDESLKQFHITPDAAKKIIKNYGLHNGYQSYLLDREGRIMARYPAVSDVEKIVG